jgi:hypothetical protein
MSIQRREETYFCLTTALALPPLSKIESERPSRGCQGPGDPAAAPVPSQSWHPAAIAGIQLWRPEGAIVLKPQRPKASPVDAHKASSSLTSVVTTAAKERADASESRMTLIDQGVGIDARTSALNGDSMRACVRAACARAGVCVCACVCVRVCVHVRVHVACITMCTLIMYACVYALAYDKLD